MKASASKVRASDMQSLPVYERKRERERERERERGERERETDT